MLNKEQVTQLLNFLLILSVILIVTFLLYSKFSRQTTIDELQVVIEQELPKQEKFLSQEEVDIERFKIIKVTPEGDVIDTVATTPATEVTDEEVSIITNERPITSDNFGDGLVAVQITQFDETDYRAVTEIPAVTYILPDSGVELNSASVSINTGEETESLTKDIKLEGTVFSVNSTAKVVAIVEKSGSIKNVRGSDKTLITINGKSIQFSEIKIGDLVTVEGVSQIGSSEVNATLIDLVGSYQIVQ